MSPRNYHFQNMYPDIAEKYHEELSAFFPTLWYKIGHYSGLDKFFTFTPVKMIDSEKDQDLV